MKKSNIFVLLGLLICIFLLLTGCGGKAEQETGTSEDQRMTSETDGQAVDAIEEAIKLSEGNATTYRGRNEETFSFSVFGSTSGSVWGSEIYTDDSDLGTAAVHAGILKPGERGIVTIKILPGLASYNGSNKNGVTTSNYGSWGGSFEFVGEAVIEKEVASDKDDASLEGQTIDYDGGKYTGEVKNDKPHGRGTLTYRTGAIIEGEFKDGQPHGKATYYYPNGAIFTEGEFIDGELHGQATVFHPNGAFFFEGEFKNGLRHGQGTLYFDNGRIQYEGGFKDDEYHGQGTEYSSTGEIIYQGLFENGKYVGR